MNLQVELRNQLVPKDSGTGHPIPSKYGKHEGFIDPLQYEAIHVRSNLL